MVSIWWVAVALLGGTFAGVFLMALLQMAGGLPEESRSDLTNIHL